MLEEGRICGRKEGFVDEGGIWGRREGFVGGERDLWEEGEIFGRREGFVGGGRGLMVLRASGSLRDAVHTRIFACVAIYATQDD